MKKVPVLQIRQYDSVFYLGSYDPRLLVKMADRSIDLGEIQEAQRPLEKKHLQEISDYVGSDHGFLPASVMIGTREPDKLALECETDEQGRSQYFIQFPSTPEELAEYENSIDIIDGQHRLFAFDDRYRSEELKDATVYDMPFSLFLTPSLKTRRRLFTITNEKQKSVSPNLLLYLKSKLKMLNTEEERYLPLVQLLNTENRSPLKDRIIMSAERIPKGYKAKELIKIFGKAKIGEISLGTPPVLLTPDEMLKTVSAYLSGWESHYGLSYQKPGKETMTKISGLRYILLLFTVFFDHAVNTKTPFDQRYVQEVIRELELIKGLAPDETLFDSSLEFRGEGGTVKMAADDAAVLKAHLAGKISQGFNPIV
nr:DGQHR domain-containing protein [uncultured Oscillibacter sp.]